MSQQSRLLASSLLVTALVASQGCATVFKSKSSGINVTSSTPGAQILVDGQPAGVTPMTVSLSNKHDHVISVGNQQCHVSSSASTGWIVLDIFTAGTGFFVDWITHNWNGLDKSTCAFSG